MFAIYLYASVNQMIDWVNFLSCGFWFIPNKVEIRMRISARTLSATEPKPTEPRNRSSSGDYTTTITKCIARCTASESAAEKRECNRERERERERERRGGGGGGGRSEARRGGTHVNLMSVVERDGCGKHEGQRRAWGRGEHDCGEAEQRGAVHIVR